MIEYVDAALLDALFPPNASAPYQLRVTEAISVDASIEAAGIDFAGTRHMVFFADIMSYAGNDEDFSAKRQPRGIMAWCRVRRRTWLNFFAWKQIVGRCSIRAPGRYRILG